VTLGGLVILGVPVVGRPALAAPDPTCAITIRVRDNARVPAHVLMRASVEVTRIYRQAGIETLWPTSLETGSPAARHAALTVVILSDRQVERWSAAAVPRIVGGVARSGPGGGRAAYVFYGRIRMLTGQNRAQRARVLAIAMAHEIGHLLLPHNTHSSAGLMRAAWTDADLRIAQRGRLLFTSEEAELLRSRILASRQH
jgi:hypothetical protein